MKLLDTPSTLNIFLTDHCNLQCRYCFVNKHSPTDKEPGPGIFNKAIGSFLRFPGENKTIAFTGGEPFLRFEKIKKLYRYAQRNKRIKTNLTSTIASNGTLLTKSSYRFLKENGIMLKLSMDGKKKIHDYNRPFKLKKYASSYDRMISGLEKYYSSDKAKRFKIRAQLTFTPAAVNNLVENIKFICRMGFRYIDFYPTLYTQWSEKELEAAEVQFRKFTDFYISLFTDNKFKNKIFENSILHSFIKETELYRPILCRKIHLDWKGNFYLCDKAFSLQKRQQDKFIIGDSNKGIDNRLRLRLLAQKRKEIRDLTGKDCNTCKYLKYCFCPVGHYIYFSAQGLDFKRYFPGFCRISQIYIRNFLRIKRNLTGNSLFTKIYCRS